MYSNLRDVHRRNIVVWYMNLSNDVSVGRAAAYSKGYTNSKRNKEHGFIVSGLIYPRMMLSLRGVKGDIDEALVVLVVGVERTTGFSTVSRVNDRRVYRCAGRT